MEYTNEFSKLLGIKVEKVKSYKTKCEFCTLKCGAKAILYPCNDKICSNCLDSIIDSNLTCCPLCCLEFKEFKWV